MVYSVYIPNRTVWIIGIAIVFLLIVWWMSKNKNEGYSDQAIIKELEDMIHAGVQPDLITDEEVEKFKQEGRMYMEAVHHDKDKPRENFINVDEAYYPYRIYEKRHNPFYYPPYYYPYGGYSYNPYGYSYYRYPYNRALRGGGYRGNWLPHRLGWIYAY